MTAPALTMSGQVHDLKCPECGAVLVLKPSKFGVFYGCSRWRETRCPGSHSAHRSTGAPMGTQATASVKRARSNAHRAFDALWQGKRRRFSRRGAYRWMRETMKIQKSAAHIAMFDEAQCTELVRLIGELRQSPTHPRSNAQT